MDEAARREARRKLRQQAYALAGTRINLSPTETALLLIALELGEIRESRARPEFSIAAEMRHAWLARERAGAE